LKKRWIALLVITSGAFLAYFSYIRWDIPAAYACHGLSRSVLDIAEMVTTAGDSKWYFMVFVPAFVFFRFVKKNKVWAMKMLFLIISISASGLMNTLIKWIAGRNRPINLFNHGLFGFDFFKIGYELNSFPSGHSVTVFSLAAALSILFPRFGYLAFVPAAVIASSRVLLTSHYVSDVIAGAAIGMVCTLPVKYYFDRYKIELTPEAKVS
jgi:membrane-associated phospholipid phosphatase